MSTTIIVLVLKITGVILLTLISGIDLDRWLERLLDKKDSNTRYVFLVVPLLLLMLVFMIIRSF